MSTVTENISAAQVKDLREKTGAPMMDCRTALQEAKGDLEEAIVVLRKRGMASAAEEGDAQHERRRGGHLHSRRRQDRRAGGSELRERLCRAYRGLPGAAEGYRHAHRGDRSRATSVPRTSPRKTWSARRISIRAQAAATGKPACGDREDRRRQDEQVLRGSLPAGAAFHQGAVHHHQGADRARRSASWART